MSPNAGGGGRGAFGDLTPYLTYAFDACAGADVPADGQPHPPLPLPPPPHEGAGIHRLTSNIYSRIFHL